MEPRTALELSDTEGLKIQLTPGLRSDEMERRLLLAWRAGEVCNRALSFYLADMDERRLHLELGHPTTVTFAVKRLGLSKRRARDLLAAGRKLARLPKLDHALSVGELTWSKVRLVARIATPDTEQAWIEQIRPLTHEEVHAMVRRAREGDPPGRTDARAAVHRVKRLTMNAAQCRAWERVRRELAVATGAAVIRDEDVLNALLRSYSQPHTASAAGPGRAPGRRPTRATSETPAPTRAEGAQLSTRVAARTTKIRKPADPAGPTRVRRRQGADRRTSNASGQEPQRFDSRPPFLDPAWWDRPDGYFEWTSEGDRIWIEWKPESPR